MTKDKKETIWTRPFLCIVFVNFFMQMGHQMMNTLIPKYASTLGISAYLIGLMSSAFATSSLVIRPFAAPAFDVMSKRKLLAASLLGVVGVFISFGLTRNYKALLVGRLLQGVFMGCVAPLCLAVAGETVPPHLMASGIGFFSMAQAVAQAAGPNAGLELSRRLGYAPAFFSGAAIMGAAVVCVLLIPETHGERKPYRIALNSIVEKASILPAILMFVFSGCFSTVNSYIAIFGGLLGVEQIGLFYTVFAVFLLISRPVSGRLIDRYGYSKILIPGILFFGLTFIIISYARSLPVFLLAGVVSAFGSGICYPAGQSLTMSCAPRDRRGAAASTNYYGADLGLLLGPSMAGMVADKVTAVSDPIHGYAVMFRVMVIPIAVSLVYFLLVRKKIQENVRKSSGNPDAIV